MKRTSAFLASRSLRRIFARYHSPSSEKRAETKSPALGAPGRDFSAGGGDLWWEAKEDMRVVRLPVVEGEMSWSFRCAVMGSMWVTRTSR